MAHLTSVAHTGAMTSSATHRFGLALALAGAALLGPALPVLAQAEPQSVQVGTAAEAWYRPPPSCESPLGCGTGAALPSPFPPGTLQVGVAAGVEESRAYVQLDVSALPPGAVPVGGTLTVPVGSPADGSRAPETAKVRLCLVTGLVTDGVEGDVAEPPAIDCMAAQSPATFVPAADPQPAALTVDLAPFAAAWAAGALMQGLAVVPAEGVPPTDSWHVAFSRRDRMVEGAVPVSATLLLDSGSDTADADSALDLIFGGEQSAAPLDSSPSLDSSPPLDSSPSFDSSFDSPPAADLSLSSPSFVAEFPAVPELPSGSEPSATPPALAQQPATQPVAALPQVLTIGGFAYPAVFLLPLLLAGVAAWAGRALTRDLLPGAGSPSL